ncbi:hypothetical protein P9112_012659 [Eukaryota sp. TZLM1-RC]
MRPLSEDETRTMFEKLAKYIGENLKHLIERSDGMYCFRLHENRVYYFNESLLKASASINRKQLLSIGTCIGKFTHSGRFNLVITCLEYIAPHALHKVWVKPSSELSYLYGNNVLKSGLGRITENTPKYAGVVIFSMSDIPLGFGVAARSTIECRRADPETIVVFHQADVGEYLREENELI